MRRYRRFMGLCEPFMGSLGFRARYVGYVLSKPMKGTALAAKLTASPATVINQAYTPKGHG
jgi:hypothetical protein